MNEASKCLEKSRTSDRICRSKTARVSVAVGRIGRTEEKHEETDRCNSQSLLSSGHTTREHRKDRSAVQDTNDSCTMYEKESAGPKERGRGD
jgi:hypothetical protein